jgi:hypothetical protein
MTKLQRARELQTAALENAEQARLYAVYWRDQRPSEAAVSLAEAHAEQADTFELEAEMYGDLVRSYELLEEETI